MLQQKGLVGKVAALNKLTEQKLTAILRGDESANLDNAGRMFYVEPVYNAAHQPKAAPRAAAAPAKGALPNYMTFALHSKPGASKVIYLKFDGYTTTADSAWGAFTGTAYDTDGSPGSFSQAEQDVIQSIWQRVSEDTPRSTST